MVVLMTLSGRGLMIQSIARSCFRFPFDLERLFAGSLTFSEESQALLLRLLFGPAEVTRQVTAGGGKGEGRGGAVTGVI